MLSTRGYDLTIVQRELISTLPSFESYIRGPVIADVDDAIWLQRGGVAARHLAKASNHIVAGNSHIAAFFEALDRPVSIIPTGVEIQRFIPARIRSSQRIIGWSGTSGGYSFFTPIQAALGDLLRRNPGWTLRFISDRPPNFPALPPGQVEFQAWSAEMEAGATADMDIGLMPIDASPWSLGKCSYKMLLYMACGVPVVCSRVGMNREVLALADVGLGVDSAEDWVQALQALMYDDERRLTMGRAGRAVVEQHFSLAVVMSKWQKVLQQFQ